MNHEDTKAQRQPISARLESLAKAVVDAAFKVHSKLGPGLLESVYEVCLAHELERRGISVQRQIVLPIRYEDLTVDSGLRLDLLVDGCLIVELKAVEQLIPLYQAQLLSYLKLSGLRLGLLINFNVPLIKMGIKRVVR
ncbi:MAG: GxxExxY protein [Armatimonadota bacterium]